MSTDLVKLERGLARAQAAGDAEAVADLQERIRAAQPKQERPLQRAGADAGWQRGNVTPMSAGINDAVIKTALGVKSLFTDLSEDDRMALKGMAMEKEEDPAGFRRGAGEFAGNVLIGAAPGNQLAKLGAAAKWLPKALAPYVGTAAAAGGVEAVQHPAEGEGVGERALQKLTSAGQAAITAPILQGALRALGRTATGLFTPSAEARRLMEQGINPTLQQGADTSTLGGKAGRFIGGLTSGAMDTKERLRDEFGNALVKRATGGNVEYPQGTAGEMFQAADDFVRGQYDDFWQGAKVNLSPKATKAVAQKAGQILSNNRQLNEATQARAIVSDILGSGDTNLRLTHANYEKEIRSKISQKMREVTDMGVKQRLSEARDLLDRMVTRQGMTVGRAEVLDEINRRMFDVKRLEEALPAGALAKEGVDPMAVARAYEKALPQAAKVANTTYEDLVAPAARLWSSTPVQHRSRAMLQAGKQLGAGALGASIIAGPGPGMLALSPLVGISLLGQTGKGAKALMGGYEAQKAMARKLQELGPLAQALYTGTGTTQAEGEE